MIASLFQPPLLVSAMSYAGLALLLAGAASLLVPPRILRLRSRRAALAPLALGLPLACAGAWWPWPERRAPGRAQLDALVPEYQFAEFHEARVQGTPGTVYRAVRAVTADEIRAFRTLTWIRSPRLPWQKRRESIMHPGRQPILDVATRSGFVWLADEPGREAVVGAVVCCEPTRLANAQAFRHLTRPGVAKAAMSFRIEYLGAGDCRVTTETRVTATDPLTRRRFGLYWAFIYPGSSLLRHGWLEAIKKRAEADESMAGTSP